MLPTIVGTGNLFPKGLKSEDIVKMTLLVLHAHHQREAERIKEVISGIDELYIHKLSALFEQLLTRYPTQGEALTVLTKIIAAELDGGDSPMQPSRQDRLKSSQN